MVLSTLAPKLMNILNEGIFFFNKAKNVGITCPGCLREP